MNCERSRELMIDLLYGELEQPPQEELRGHLSACRACADEYASLRRARSALGRLAANEPSLGLLALGGRRTGAALAVAARPWRRRLAAWAACAAAAVLVAAAVVFLLHDRMLPTAVAKDVPVEIRRTGVSLTILSRPPEWDGHGSFPAGQQAEQIKMSQRWQPRTQRDAQVTVNAPPWSLSYYRDWPGLALVRDQRVIRHIKPGQTQVRFTGVPSGIWPDSVRLRCIDDSNALTILDQNYQYDLASAQAVLARHIDKAITVLFKDGQRMTGILLSFDADTLVIRPLVVLVHDDQGVEAQGPQSITRRELAAVWFERLPEGLLTTPTLLWRLANTAKETERQFEVAYLTTGLFWRADYVLKLRPANRPPLPLGEGRGEGASRVPEIIDRADMVGYATVVNNSGVTYEDAQLKLMAGDVNLLVRPYGYDITDTDGDALLGRVGVAGSQPQMVEKSFFEYHLYTLTRPTTLADNETKQLEMVSGRNLALRRGYVYDPTGNPTAARVVSEIENSEANGLGKPLPKGVIRLYAPDPEGVQTYVSQTEIDHTPVKEKLRLPWGYAFDIACGWREVDAKHAGTDHHITAECSLRNHKDHDVTITVIVHVPASTYKAQCNLPWHVREVGLIEVTATVPANQETKFTFEYKFNDLSGGGLRSPNDQPNSGKPSSEGAMQ